VTFTYVFLPLSVVMSVLPVYYSSPVLYHSEVCLSVCAYVCVHMMYYLQLLILALFVWLVGDIQGLLASKHRCAMVQLAVKSSDWIR